MRPRRKPHTGMLGSRRRRRGFGEGENDVFWLDGEQPETQLPEDRPSRPSYQPQQPPPAQRPQPTQRSHQQFRDYPSQAPQMTPAPRQMPPVPDAFDTTGPIARTASGWRVGDEEVSDLTSAMVLADLLA